MENSAGVETMREGADLPKCLLARPSLAAYPQHFHCVRLPAALARCTPRPFQRQIRQDRGARESLGKPRAMTALLDTHVLIWWLNDRSRLSPTQQEAVGSAGPESPRLVADKSLWEVATLHSLGRIRLAVPLREWLDKAGQWRRRWYVDTESPPRLRPRWLRCQIRSTVTRPIGFWWQPSGCSAPPC